MVHDACIVGSGPGGLLLAKKLAENGMQPLVLEKNKNVTDAFCGELTVKNTLKILGLSKNSEIISNRINRVEIINLDNKIKMEINRRGKDEGLLLDSSLLKKYLKETAESNGAVFKFKVNVTNVIKSRGFVAGVRTGGKIYDSNITVGADGSMSIIARKAGFDLSGFKALPSFRFKFKKCKDLDTNCTYFYLGRDIGLGYMWLYPRSETEANVGIGSINSKNMLAIFNRFIKSRHELRGAKITDKNGDNIPYSGLLPRFSTLLGAKMASETILNAVRQGDYSEATLEMYEDKYRKNDNARQIQKTAGYLSKIIRFSKKTDVFDYVDEILQTIDADFIDKIISGKFSKTKLMKTLLKNPTLILRIFKDYYF